eukprot:TRINITY_DN3003_c0_g1_i2.p1 TRINITY_DN3003_c0_g1~~TRINITY_DN3003_c0_g1_i2.p1  ORF type:complete len:159 (+),score=2.79 TRINITY_DN3003_c0_g1_i2:233-709(+)
MINLETNSTMRVERLIQFINLGSHAETVTSGAPSGRHQRIKDDSTCLLIYNWAATSLHVYASSSGTIPQTQFLKPGASWMTKYPPTTARGSHPAKARLFLTALRPMVTAVCASFWRPAGVGTVVRACQTGAVHRFTSRSPACPNPFPMASRDQPRTLR